MNLQHEGLTARPSIRSDTNIAALAGGLILWAESRPAIEILDRFGAALVMHFNGSSPIREIAEDFALAIDVDIERAEAFSIALTRRLARAGLLDGCEPILALETEADQAPASPATHVEELPGGGMVYTSTIVIDSAAGGDDAVAVEELLKGDRSPSEFIPAGSCAGSKLRAGEELPTIGISLDGRVVSIRCNHAESAELIRQTSGTSVTDEKGPVEAWVIGPLEGSGPPRVYDRNGVRRGRTRTAADAVRMVTELLWPPNHSDQALPLATAIAIRDGKCALAPERFFAIPRAAHLLARRGIAVHLSPPSLSSSGQISVTSRDLDGSRQITWPVVPVGAIIVANEHASLEPTARLIEGLCQEVPSRGRGLTHELVGALLKTMGGIPIVEIPIDDLRRGDAFAAEIDRLLS